MSSFTNSGYSSIQEECVLADGPRTAYAIKNCAKGLVVDADKYTPDQLPSFSAESWTSYNEATDLLGYGNKTKNLWLTFKVNNPLPEPETYYLRMFAPFLAFIDFVFVGEDGESKVISSSHHTTIGSRPVYHHDYVFEFRLPAASTGQIYLRFKDTIQAVFNPLVYGYQKFEATDRTEQFWFGIYIGCVLIMVFYTLMLWFSSRKNLHLYYMATVLFGFGGAILNAEGLLRFFVFPWAATWAPYLITCVTGYGILFTTLFVSNLLQIQEHSPRLNKFTRIYLWVIAGLPILFLGNDATLMFTLSISISLLNTPLTFALAFTALKKVAVANYYVVAWVLLHVGTTTKILALIGVIEQNLFTNNVIFLGAGLEMAVFAVAIGLQIKGLEEKQSRIIQKSQSKLREAIQQTTTRLEQNHFDCRKISTTPIRSKKPYFRKKKIF